MKFDTSKLTIEAQVEAQIPLLKTRTTEQLSTAYKILSTTIGEDKKNKEHYMKLQKHISVMLSYRREEELVAIRENKEVLQEQMKRTMVA